MGLYKVVLIVRWSLDAKAGLYLLIYALFCESDKQLRNPLYIMYHKGVKGGRIREVSGRCVGVVPTIGQIEGARALAGAKLWGQAYTKYHFLSWAHSLTR